MFSNNLFSLLVLLAWLDYEEPAHYVEVAEKSQKIKFRIMFSRPELYVYLQVKENAQEAMAQVGQCTQKLETAELLSRYNASQLRT